MGAAKELDVEHTAAGHGDPPDPTTSSDDSKSSGGRPERDWNIQCKREDRKHGRPEWFPNKKSKPFRKQQDVDVLCLQEVKNSEERLEHQLARIIPGATVVVDLQDTAAGGTTILVNPEVQILESGSKVDGTCAWVKIMTAPSKNHLEEQLREWAGLKDWEYGVPGAVFCALQKL
ncbi:hypothetical protein R1sor_015833 [Riccia sorocarpa]|uniref:Endonuclease/exonuclease/phosphatase domain-containing protein n=1 Tax=Riccia sorocarpa TaxID=122646 RepID=A0ABD3HJG6_9MARC